MELARPRAGERQRRLCIAARGRAGSSQIPISSSGTYEPFSNSNWRRPAASTSTNCRIWIGDSPRVNKIFVPDMARIAERIRPGHAAQMLASAQRDMRAGLFILQHISPDARHRITPQAQLGHVAAAGISEEKFAQPS